MKTSVSMRQWERHNITTDKGGRLVTRKGGVLVLTPGSPLVGGFSILVPSSSARWRRGPCSATRWSTTRRLATRRSAASGKLLLSRAPRQTLRCSDTRCQRARRRCPAKRSAAVGTATVLVWGVGVGSTAVSLATADGAAAVGPRRKMLGAQAFAAAAPVGTLAAGFERQFETPIVAPPGAFVHIILKIPQGAATASLIFRGGVDINGHFE